VEIKEAFIDFNPLDVKTAGVGHKKIKQKWLVLILVFKSEFLIQIHQVSVPCNNHSLNWVGVHADHVNV
jgi:uncharacterized protein Veg